MTKLVRDFVSGMGSVLDFRPADEVRSKFKYLVSSSGSGKVVCVVTYGEDRDAIERDWRKVGGDIRTAADKFRREHVVADG